MIKDIRIAFAGFGEINTPIELLKEKCTTAEKELINEGLNVVESVYPITDTYDEKEINAAVARLSAAAPFYDTLVICIAGWIPTHAVIKVTEQLKHKPMILWGLCGKITDGRIVTTAEQAGTSALRGVFQALGYTFKYVYNIIGKPSKTAEIVSYCNAVNAASILRSAKAGMMGYRDMNLYGTLYDGLSLKKVTGIEIETFEMLEIKQRYDKITDSEKEKLAEEVMKDWKFISPAGKEAKTSAAGYYAAVSMLAKERGYKAISLKDVDGMKKLLGYPPAPIFMLLSNLDGLCTVPENDALGCATQLILKALTGQCAAYLEFYEFMDDRVLAGVPDFIPAEITDGDITVMPAAFGELSEGILNVSKVKPGVVTLCRLGYMNGKYVMHTVCGNGVTPQKWEEAGWAQPAPQLPALEIILDNTEDFTQKVLCQHYFITYGDNRKQIKELCDILGIDLI